MLLLSRCVTLHFNGGRGGGRAMVINGNTGIDTGILRHQVTDLQQDVTRIPGEEEEEEEHRGGGIEKENKLKFNPV